MKPTGNGETDGALPSPLVSRVMRVMRRLLGCSRLRAGAQQHARAAFAALQPIEPHSDTYRALTVGGLGEGEALPY